MYYFCFVKKIPIFFTFIYLKGIFCVVTAAGSNISVGLLFRGGESFSLRLCIRHFTNKIFFPPHAPWTWVCTLQRLLEYLLKKTEPYWCQEFFPNILMLSTFSEAIWRFKTFREVVTLFRKAVKLIKSFSLFSIFFRYCAVLAFKKSYNKIYIHQK